MQNKGSKKKKKKKILIIDLQDLDGEWPISNTHTGYKLYYFTKGNAWISVSGMIQTKCALCTIAKHREAGKEGKDAFLKLINFNNVISSVLINGVSV